MCPTSEIGGNPWCVYKYYTALLYLLVLTRIVLACYFIFGILSVSNYTHLLLLVVHSRAAVFFSVWSVE